MYTMSAGNNRLAQEHSGHYSGFLDNQHDPTSDDITPIEFICDTHNVCNASYIYYQEYSIYSLCTLDT